MNFVLIYSVIEEKLVTAECATARIIAIKSQTNWLMPMGARECNSNIQHNSICLLMEVLSDSNFGVHHSSTLNCICFWLCPSLLK